MPFSAMNLMKYAGLILLILLVSPGLAQEPVEVGVSLKVHQITNIDQKAENFGAVATLVLRYNEPGLAARPGEQVEPQRMYMAQEFVRMLTDRGLSWPAHSFYNVQGRMDYQNQ